MKLRSLLPMLAFVALTTLPACDDTADEVFVAHLDGKSEGVTTQAQGDATIVVSRSERRADVTISITGIVGVSDSHIHRGRPGEAGPAILSLYDPTRDWNQPFGFTWPRSIAAAPPQYGAVTYDPQPWGPSPLQDLRAGNVYINVHTNARPSGEIRGQFVRQ